MEYARLKIGEWAVSPALNLLEHDGRSTEIEPRAMDLLVFLAEHAGEVFSTDALITVIWRGRVVSDDAVYRLIKQLRDALGDDSRDPRYIATIPRRGYVLVASVEILRDPRPLLDSSRLQRIFPRRWQQVTAFSVCAALSLALALYLLPSSPFSRSALLDPQTVAVLPFVNLSSDDSSEYLGDSIAEEIIHALANASGLRVVARTSSFSFKESPAEVKEIGERLGASVILEGSVRRENGRLRVMAQLVESETGHHLWSEAFDGPIGELITMERDIAIAVAERILGENADLASVTATLETAVDIDAYDYYLLGRHHLRNPSGGIARWSAAEANRSIAYFRRAVEEDPSFARAYTGLADALLLQYFIGKNWRRPGFSVPSELAMEVTALIEQALMLDPQLAEAYVSRGLAIERIEHDGERARAAFQQAIAISPNLAAAHYELGKLLAGVEEGLAALRTAAQLNPMSVETEVWLARSLNAHGRYEEAAMHTANALLLEPTSAQAFIQAARQKWLIGRPDEAIRILQPLLGDPDVQSEQAAVRAELAAFYLDLDDAQTAAELLDSQSDTGSDGVVVINSRVHLALAQDRYDDAADLFQYGRVRALYEMVIGHEDHARDLYEDPASQREDRYEDPNSQTNLLSIKGDLPWGYYPAVNAAHLYLKAGDEIAAGQMLEGARVELESALEDQYSAGGAYYVLASIDAIEGDSEQALAALEEAINHGWTRHWYAVRDPNLENLHDDSRFQSLIDSLKTEMDRLRLAM